MSDFIIEPSFSYLATANQPETIKVRPSKTNTGDQPIIRRLKISASAPASNFEPYYITITQGAAPTTNT